MALARRRSADNFIWPGFVDGLATLLMVIIFVLMVFFLIQVNLVDRISGQDTTLAKLRGEIAQITNLLNIERLKSEELASTNQELNFALEQATQKAAELQSALTGLTSRAEQAEAEIIKNQQVIEELGTQVTSLQETRQRIEAENASKDTVINASRKEILGLTRALDAIRQKLAQVQALLDEKELEALEAREASVNLSRRLNDALSSKIIELQDFRSEFFGQMRKILKDRSDIIIVGDRFVFQSEVLFDLGSADIGLEGERQLREFGEALNEISRKIPTDIDWVLQVAGHTDNLPISTPRFKDNWDLSTERAISVVRYLVLAGIEPKRLSVAGFGENQPVDTANSATARAKNRRIELKITRR